MQWHTEWTEDSSSTIKCIRKPFSLACSDLEIFYDRIVHITSSIALQLFGSPISAIVSVLEGIQEIPHIVRTPFGYSETTYGVIQIPNGFKNNMLVLLQVNVSAPQIWSIFILVIFAALIEQGFGIHLYNSFTGELTGLVWFRYVDNCDLIQSGDIIDTTHQYMKDALL